MQENDIAKQVVDAAYQVHVSLGPGLLESVYEAALEYELTSRGMAVSRQTSIPITYKGIDLGEGFKADLIIEDLVILELKSVEAVAPVHTKQLLTYLRLTNRKLGLLINFGARRIKDGITRVVNGL